MSRDRGMITLFRRLTIGLVALALPLGLMGVAAVPAAAQTSAPSKEVVCADLADWMDISNSQYQYYKSIGDTEQANDWLNEGIWAGTQYIRNGCLA